MPAWRIVPSVAPWTNCSKLDGELDVAQAAGAELELHVDLVGRDVLGDALAHALHRLDESLTRGAGPHLGADARGVPVAELGVARERAGLQQRLELPALGPPVVVLQVRLERAHERAVLALGPEVRVDLPQRRLDAGSPMTASRSSRGASRRRARERRHGLLVGGLGDEDDVDVADVVELAGAGLAHADDREARRLDLRGRKRPGRRARRRHGRPCGARCSAASSAAPARVGQAGRHGVDRGDRIGAGEVPDRDPREHTPVSDAQRPAPASASVAIGASTDATASTSSAAAASAEGGRTGSSWAPRARRGCAAGTPRASGAAEQARRAVERCGSQDRLDRRACARRPLQLGERLVGVAGGGECYRVPSAPVRSRPRARRAASQPGPGRRIRRERAEHRQLPRHPLALVRGSRGCGAARTA